jgi:hypothetical protein
MRVHLQAACVAIASVVAGNAGLAQAPQNVVSARDAEEALVAAALYVLESDGLRFKGDTLPMFVHQASVRQLRLGRQGPIGISVQTSQRHNPGVEPGQELSQAAKVALAITKSGIAARPVDVAAVNQACPLHPRGVGQSGRVCDFAGALSLAMALGYPEINKGRLIVPISVLSDQTTADGRSQTTNATIVFNLIGGRWQVTGHEPLVGR